MLDHLDPRYRPIVYDVAMSPEHINQWTAAGPSTGNRTRAAQAGRRGGRASFQVRVTDCHPWTPGLGVTAAAVQGDKSRAQG
jgi:hypothetical protein